MFALRLHSHSLACFLAHSHSLSCVARIRIHCHMAARYGLFVVLVAFLALGAYAQVQPGVKLTVQSQFLNQVRASFDSLVALARTHSHSLAG